ncbi:oxidized purine nucleoside triphosphate hydrolase-like [Daphnia pulicaria]|uniref:oxidized purine nucleoside triphosphate hydrolase-like n=1 Tax=Daphnia pulicaria TaxID=35523 RepID=UPI001EE9C49D|nr:oxidized purine nucleoside triphosphate hydrolase-like [Daphnia pulicaria]XP_046638544.1 oxidized purine nucleoside triphosphate hydrolase-like [Daphnia pulicaria]XP_046638545.1 oxidized purine nucleoside triphosphate hydrolase-like [Daphnia pulicaria]XP_046638546.1 oxidized purine nucleoside triphosphate hydrolase-like [Daphnia pulicaria]
MKMFTLVLVLKKSEILLGLKKRGFGEGKWNGFGGKIESGESVIQAAIRELHEESGIMTEESNLTKCGIINMDFSNGETPFKIHVFRCSEYKGEILETEEMKPQWFDVQHIPYDLMWSEARIWFPVFLSGTSFHASFSFNALGDIIKHTIIQKP